MPPAWETVPLGWATEMPIRRSRKVPALCRSGPQRAGGDQPADGRVLATGRIERQALPVLGQDRLDVAEAGPGAHREDEIGRLVVDDPAQAFGREDRSRGAPEDFPGSSAVPPPTGATAWPRAAASARRSATLLAAARNDDLGRGHAVDRTVVRADCDSLGVRGHRCRASAPSPACAGRGPRRTCSPWGRSSPG